MIAWQCTPSIGMSMVGPVDRAVGQFVIQRAGEDARGRRLADAAHAGEDPGLRNAPGLERVRDGAHHRVLADQVGEGRGAVFARQHAVGRPPARAEVEVRGSGVVHARPIVHRLSAAIRCRDERGIDSLHADECVKEWEADERPES